MLYLYKYTAAHHDNSTNMKNSSNSNYDSKLELQRGLNNDKYCSFNIDNNYIASISLLAFIWLI
jgi:hypothetical protein